MIKLTNNYQVLIILFLSYTLTHIVGTGNRSSVLLLAIYDAAQRSQLAKTHSQSTKKSGKNYLIFRFKEMCTSKLKKVIKKVKNEENKMIQSTISKRPAEAVFLSLMLSFKHYERHFSVFIGHLNPLLMLKM